MENTQTEVIKLADDYFGFMLRAYPIMSLSDEFYFLPRASKTGEYLNCLDSLEEEKIKEDISYLQALLRGLDDLNTDKLGLETEIDLEMLKASMKGFLHEFKQAKIWQSDPNLYLKIVVAGLEQIVDKLIMVKKDIREELASRIKQIPRLLKQAQVNLKKVNLVHQAAAIQTAKGLIKYLPDIRHILYRADRFARWQ